MAFSNLMAEALICQYGSGQSSLGDTRKDTFTETDFILKYSFSNQSTPSKNKINNGWSSQNGGGVAGLFINANNPSILSPTVWTKSIKDIITNPLCDVERSVLTITAEYISHSNLSISNSAASVQLYLSFMVDNYAITDLTYLRYIEDSRNLYLGNIKDDSFTTIKSSTQYDMLAADEIPIISLPLESWRQLSSSNITFGILAASYGDDVYWASKNGEISFKVNLKCDIIYKDFRG